MPLPALLFPDTVLRPSVLARLAPLCQPVFVLAPPSLDRDAQPAFPDDLALVLRPLDGVGADAAGQAEPRRMAALLRQWEQWARQNQGSGLLAAVKAGVLPQPPETVRTVMAELKNYGDSSVGRQQPPAVAADLFLHLAHIHDRQAAELEQALAQYDRDRRKLEQTIGRSLEDHDPTDFEDVELDALPPVDYSQALDHLLPRRLVAWATLAEALPDDDGRWLTTVNAQAAQTLLDRANAGLSPADAHRKSPAGAAAPQTPPAPAPGSAMAQEAAGLDLPDLTVLDAEELAALTQKLGPGLEAVQARLGALLTSLAGQPWNAQAQTAAATEAAAIGQAHADLLVAAGVATARTRRLAILVFPGLDRRQVLGLMLGKPATGGLAGACPLLLIH